MCPNSDGYVTTPDGWPAQLADPGIRLGSEPGIQEFLRCKEAALDTRLVLARERSVPGGSVEIVYACA